MSLQSTSGDKCIFREDFISPASVVANGGVVTGALVFDGKTTAVASSKIVYSNTQSFLSNITKCSFHIKGFKTSSVSGTGYIVSKYNSADGIQIVIMQYNNYLRIYVGSGGGNYADTAAASVVADTEYDIVVSYDGTLAAASRLAVYMNNTAKSLSISGTIPASFGKNSSRIAVFGYDDSSAAKEGMSVKDIDIFSGVALNTEEVKDIYEQDAIPELDRAIIDLPLRSSYYKENGTQLLTDGDMEAVGVTAWTVDNSAVLTKQAGSPSGSGSQVLRVTHGGVNAPGTYQTILTSGKKYKITGYVRSDGTAVPKVALNTVQVYLGSTSTSWTYFEATGETNGTRLYLQSFPYGTAGNYVEWDDVTCELMEAVTENKGTLGGTAKLGDGSTTTTMPTLLGPKGINGFNGSKYLDIGVSNSFASTDAFSIGFMYKGIPTLDTYHYLSSYDGAQGKGAVLATVLGNGFSFYLSGVVYVKSDLCVPPGTHTVIGTYDGSGSNLGLKIYIDGIDVSTIRSGIPSDIASDKSFLVGAGHNGASKGFLLNNSSIKIFDPFVIDKELTPQQISIKHAQLIKGLNV